METNEPVEPGAYRPAIGHTRDSDFRAGWASAIRHVLVEVSLSVKARKRIEIMLRSALQFDEDANGEQSHG